MKKTISISLALLIAIGIIYCSLFSSFSLEKKTMVYAQNVKILSEKQDEVDISVNISGNTGLMGFMFVIEYDHNVLCPLNVTKGYAVGNGLFNDSIGTTQDGLFKVVWTGSDNSYANGLLFTVRFKIITQDFSSTQINLNYSQADTFDEEYSDVLVNCKEAIVSSFYSVFLGDADNDNEVSVIDATTIQRVLAKMNVEAYVEKAADTDGDGVVSIMDATMMQKYLAKMLTDSNIGKVIMK